MPRSVQEWIGKTDDTPAPPRVRLRVLERFDRCCDPAGGCGRRIRPGDKWICDHRLAIEVGGGIRGGHALWIVGGRAVDAHRKSPEHLESALGPMPPAGTD